MNVVGIIPARIGSSRFPGKPLALIQGIPMIGHCFLRSKMCSELSEVYVATCDREIHDYVVSIGGKAVMTSSDHERASDRTAEAMLKIERASGVQIDIVVMIQGDEPMIVPEMISASLEPFDNQSVNVVNLMANLTSVEEFEDPNEVKVVVNNNNEALYFSREPIPSRKKGAHRVPMLKQVCIIPFRRDYLLKFNQIDQGELEQAESVDMMRVLEVGDKVHMVHTPYETYSVDTPDDLAHVDRLMHADKLIGHYQN